LPFWRFWISDTRRPMRNGSRSVRQKRHRVRSVIPAARFGTTEEFGVFAAFLRITIATEEKTNFDVMIPYHKL
jgi:hypothetical protein